MNAEQRMELVLQATDKASARLQDVRKQIEAVRDASRSANTTAAGAGTAIERIGGKSANLRGTAMAISSIAYAAESATLGSRSAVIAIGSLAQAGAATSARLAMWSPHIAAATVVAGTLLALVQRIRGEAENIKNPLAGVLGRLDPSQAELFHLRTKETRDAALRAIEESSAHPQSKEAANLARAHKQAIVSEQEAYAFLVRVRSDSKRKERDDAKRDAERATEQATAAVEKRGVLLVELENKIATSGVRSRAEAEMLRIQQQFQAHAAEIDGLRKHGADVVELTLANERWKQAELARIRDEGITRALDLEAELGRRILTAQAQGKDEQYRIEELNINRDAGRRLAEIEAMEVDEERKKVLRAQSAELQSAELERASRRDAQRQLQAAQQLHAQRIAQVHALVISQKALGKALIAFALEPIVKQLEGIAVKEGVKALESFMNPFAAAKHAAVAGAALLAARQVASMGGLGSGGGGGSAGSGGAGGEIGTFEPRSGQAGAGSITINLITRNPYGRDEIQQTIFSLERAGLLKRRGVEIPIPPTTGLDQP